MTEVPSAGRVAGSLDEPRPDTADSVGQMILDRVAESGSREAFRAPRDGGWQSYTWDEALDVSSSLAAGLVSLGLEPEERVAIACSTRFEWVMSDYAIMFSGGATTTVYPTTGEDDVIFILDDSDTRILIAEDQTQAEKALAGIDALPNLKAIVLIDGTFTGDAKGLTIMTWDEVIASGKEYLQQNPSVITDRVNATNRDSLATLIYTSGTTGRPKGVELTQGNWVYEGSAMTALGVANENDVQYMWLPLAHVFGKVLMLVQIETGHVMAVDGRVPKISENLPVLQPTLMAAVPRIFEKVHAGVQAKMAAAGGMKEKIFHWALKNGAEAREKRMAGEKVGGWLGFKVSMADKLVFSKIREAMGGRMRYMVSGGAALSSDINIFFDIMGLTILEGYGLTETSGATCVNRPGNIGPGTVGEPLPGSEVKVAADGELLIRGGGVMRGYHNRPDENEEVFGVEKGWFATGDIGVIDDGGRIKITDRKKDLVKTSGGKYIAPGAIEAQFKAHLSLAGAVLIVANGRKFASALIALDPDATKAWAEAQGLTQTTIAELHDNPELMAVIEAAVDSVNQELNHWETIKQYRVLPRDLTVDGGELTPSLKVKRKVVEDEFGDVIESMYS